MMRCREVVHAIHEILDGEASPEVAAQLHEHARQCAACAQEYQRLRYWDGLLRARDADEPEAPHFDRMARAIAVRVGQKERRQPLFVPSWSFATSLAAACLVIGLALGHLAFPRTIPQVRTETRTVRGPVRTVTVERPVVERAPVRVEVRVPVVKWRTRYVTVRSAAPSPVAPVALTAGYGSPTPVGAAVASADVPTTAYGTGGRAVAVRYASYSPGGPTEARLTPSEYRALARRLTEDMGTLDRALNAPRLAETLVNTVDSAGAGIERALETSAPTRPNE